MGQLLVRDASQVLTLFVTAEKASEVYIALASAPGNKGFFENKGPDPTVWTRKLPLLESFLTPTRTQI